MDCMNPVDGNGKKADFPLFMKYTRDVPVTKNGKDLPYDVISAARDKIKGRINPELICPMNYLQAHLDTIQGASRKHTIPTEDFFIRMSGAGNSRQVSKVVQLAKEYDTYLKQNIDKLYDDAARFEFIEKTQDFYDKVAKIKISNIVTINRLIEIALNLDVADNKIKRNFKHLEAHKYGRLILKSLYKSDPEKFLSSFAPG